MKNTFSPRKINVFLFTKLPAAFFCGVRLETINNQICKTRVKHRWLNQNPFGSMYFAVQAMAAELSTGALVLKEISDSSQKVSMLVKEHKSSFSKKATGKIIFSCSDVAEVAQAVKKTCETGEGVTFWMQSEGVNEQDEVVSTHHFQWTVKLKKSSKN